jgi:manganese/zinc/iron transport system permease protein
MIEFLINLFTDYTFQIVALGSAILGIVSGALGCFAVLRKQSLIGDAMSHAALPGIVLAFILFRSKTPLVLMVGAIIAGWIGTLALMAITHNTRIKQDSALGFVLSVFFGVGLVMLTFVQRLPDARQAGLDRFLFGQAASMLEVDVISMGLLGGIALLLMGLFWKEFKLLSFDLEFGASLGFPMRFMDVLLTTLMVVAIVIGLQAVGVVLMSAMIVAPAAAARQWTDRLGKMVALAAVFGALAGVGGSFISSMVPRLSTGPTIVLAISMIVLVSLLLAPNRGLLWAWARHQRNRRKLRVEAVLGDLYTLSLQHDDPNHPHSIQVLRTMQPGEVGVQRSLEELKSRGWASGGNQEGWHLTPQGLDEALQRGLDLENHREVENDNRTS